MTNGEPTSSAPVPAAIDISKHRHEVLIEVPGRKRRRRVTVLNSLEEFNHLIELLPFQRTELAAAHLRENVIIRFDGGSNQTVKLGKSQC